MLFLTEAVMSDKKKIILGLMLGLFLAVSFWFGPKLFKKSQEVRKGAAGCDGSWACGKTCPADCDRECLPNADCQAQSTQLCRCKERPAPPSGGGGGSGSGQSCGTANGGSCPSGEHCCKDGCNIGGSQEGGTCLTTCSIQGVCGSGGGGGNPNCATCQGSCDRSGCDVNGSGVNCKTDCGMWPACFYCHGQTNSGCGGGNYHKDTSIEYDKQYWCSTVQCDSNAANSAAIVVEIGDSGEWCITDGKCAASVNDRNKDGKINGKDLDWDCSESTPTPTPTPTYTVNCSGVKAYDINWQQITDYSSLKPGTKIYFTVYGTTDHPSGITKGRIKVNSGNWQETTAKHNNEFYISYQIPVGGYGEYSAWGEVYNSNLGWK